MKKITTTVLICIFVLSSATLVLGFDEPIEDDVEVEEEEIEEQLVGHVITEIEVIGNDIITEEEILAEVETEIGAEIEQEKLQDDMQSIFDMGYFMDLEVAFKNYQDGVMLIFELIENPVIEEVAFSGNERKSDEELKDLLGVAENEVLNINHLDLGLENLMMSYEKEGYALAQIMNVSLGEEDDILEITIDEGKINDVIIQGNTETKDYVIKRELSIEAGDILNINEMWQDLSRLYNLGYFEDVAPTIDGDQFDPMAANLVINVEEGRTGTFSLGGGYSPETGFNGILHLSENNLFGRGQQVEADLNYGQRSNRVELGFADRWAFGTRTSIETNFNWNTGEGIPGISDDNYGQRLGGDLMLGRPLTDTIRAYVKFDANRLLDYGEDKNMEDRESTENTFSVSLQGVRDARDNQFNPREGNRQQMALEQGFGLGDDDKNFRKASLDLRQYFPVGDEHSVAIRGKLGVGTDDLPGTARYHLRMQDEVRGYDSDYRSDNSELFQGDSMALASIEYRHSVLDNVSLISFFDAGRTFEGQNFELENINHSIGVGARVDTPIGPLGLDYGYALDEGEGDFSIRVGTSF